MKNKVIIVSGASKGLGAVMAKSLAAEGYYVAVNYRTDKKGASAVVDEIESNGGKALMIHGDVTKKEDVSSLMKTVNEKMGHVYGIVNNAVAPHDGYLFEELKIEDYDNQYACSVKAPLLLLEAALESMKRSGEGRIINIGSEIQIQGQPDFSHYAMGKMAMQGLTRTWAKGLGKYNITVNMICPGWTPVERHRGSEETQQKQADLNPMGRLGKPEDIASAVIYFCSRGAGFVSGQLLAINGAATIA